MADNNFKGTVEALFTGIDGVVSSKTVVGDAIHIGDTITKILDMVPDMVDKFTGGKDSKLDENDVKDILDGADVQ